MICHRVVALSAFIAAALGITVISFVISKNDISCQKIVPVPDVERRLEPLGNSSDEKLVDVSGFTGMPPQFSEAASNFVEALLAGIDAAPMMRQRFYGKERNTDAYRGVNPVYDEHDFDRYPDYADVIFDRDVPVPLMLFPRPDSVRRWSASSTAGNLGWRTLECATSNRGSVYGRTLIYDPGKISKNPNSLPASPFRSQIPSWDLYIPEHDTTFFLTLGKLLSTPHHDGLNETLVDDSANLRLGEKDGGRLLAELITVPAYLKNNRLRWVSDEKATNVRRFLAYALVDGNGIKRGKGRFQETADGPISPYVRPLVCKRHQPKIHQHDELLLPSPMGWPQTRLGGGEIDGFAHEEWCMDDWFPAQKDACWVIREAKDSKPLQESFLLMPASEASDRPVFFIALFAETEPKRLIQELAALYKVSPDKALNSPETMQRLQTLYEKVRDFPLDK